MRNPLTTLTPVEALRTALCQLTLDDIVSFEVSFRRHLNDAHTWDLCGAACVILSGCSDDTFEYFRRWLVSKGRDVYEAALADPDSLASVQPGQEGVWDFEEVYYVAMEVFEEKGGAGDVRDYSEPEADMDGHALSGEPLAHGEEHLARRYPRLWQRFGQPLG